MYVAVQHTISDPLTFWKVAQAGTENLPAGVTLHHTFPSCDGRRAICIWEANSLETVKSFLDRAVGKVSRNEYFEIPNHEAVAFPNIFEVAA